MKSRLVLLFLLFASLSLSAQKYNDPEALAEKAWKEVVQLLQAEAAFFEGKKGRIRLRQSEFTDFIFNKLSVSENQLTIETHSTNRFFPEELKEQIKKETYQFYPLEFRIKSVGFAYGDQYYFDHFPEWVFLKIELFRKDINQKTELKEQNPKTKIWNVLPVEETETDGFQLPIRTKNREKILKGIGRFQSTLLKKDLEDEINH